MKNILYIHQYFITPKQAGGTRSYWFAQELIKNNYKVTMLTSRDKQDKLIQKENIDGIDVIYIKNEYDNSFSIFRRLFSFIRFMLLSSFIAYKEKDIDFVFATSTPLTIGVPALFLKWFKKKKFIFEVRDVWPEVPIQMGGINNTLIIYLLRKFEKIIYNNSEHIIALSPGMKQEILKTGIKESKVSIVPNMSKIDQFYARVKNKKIMTEYNLSNNSFYVIHFGAMGLANGLDYILDAAKILQKKKDNNIKFLFAGSGSQETHLKKRQLEEAIDNIAFLGEFNMNKMAEIVNIADCSITTFSNLQILQTNSPNKLFDSLSAQKPIIVNSEGWTKKMVNEHKCGAYVDPAKPEELANLLTQWKNEPAIIHEMGVNSRKLAETTYDKSILSKQFIKILCNHINIVS